MRIKTATQDVNLSANEIATGLTVGIFSVLMIGIGVGIFIGLTAGDHDPTTVSGYIGRAVIAILELVLMGLSWRAVIMLGTLLRRTTRVGKVSHLAWMVLTSEDFPWVIARQWEVLRMGDEDAAEIWDDLWDQWLERHDNMRDDEEGGIHRGRDDD